MHVDAQQITANRAFSAYRSVKNDERSVSFATPPNQLRACISGARK